MGIYIMFSEEYYKVKYMKYKKKYLEMKKNMRGGNIFKKIADGADKLTFKTSKEPQYEGRPACIERTIKDCKMPGIEEGDNACDVLKFDSGGNVCMAKKNFPKKISGKTIMGPAYGIYKKQYEKTEKIETEINR